MSAVALEDMTVAQMVEMARDMIRRVPAAYQNWGVQRVREFKRAANMVYAHLRLKQPQRHLLLRDLKALKVFY